MKTIRIIFASIVLMIALSACGNNNQGGTDNNNTENSENTLNTTEDIQPDTMTNDEDDTFDYNRTQDDDYMRSKMEDLNFNEISIEIIYQDGKEYEVEIDQDRNEPMEAKVEDDLNNAFLQGKDAFDHIFERAKKLEITKENSDQDVIKQVLQSFNLPEDYTEFEIEITFNDGKKLDVEDRK